MKVAPRSRVNNYVSDAQALSSSALLEIKFSRKWWWEFYADLSAARLRLGQFYGLFKASSADFEPSREAGLFQRSVNKKTRAVLCSAETFWTRLMNASIV